MRTSIHYKITLTFGIIIAIVLTGIYFYLNISLSEHTYQRIRDNLLKETLLVKDFLEKRFDKSLKSDELDKLADEIGADLEIRVTIIGFDGKVLGDSELNAENLLNVENHLHRTEVQQAFKEGIGESRRFSTTIKKDMLYIANLFTKGDFKAVVRLAVPLSEIDLISAHIKKMLIVSLLLAFGLAVIISVVASAFITKPIKEISQTAKAIAGGDFSHKTFINKKDEIGDLAETFNYMSEQVKKRIDEITSGKLRFEAVLMSMIEGVMVIDTSGQLLLMNLALKDSLQIKDDPTGKQPLEVIRNIEIQEIADNIVKLKHGVESREITILMPKEKTLLVHATPIIREGKNEGAVLVFHDITELRKLEQIRQDFVANVSHELRTPVASVKGYAETLLDGALSDEENAEDFVKIIYSDSERLAALIDDLLDLAKIESGKLKMTLEKCTIAPLTERITSGLKRKVKDKSITINMDIPNDLPEIIADEDRIAQVLLNLIDNAIKYTKENGTVTVSATEKDRFVQVDVSDNGAGIPESDLPRIFERFYRVDKARSRELGGTGLGLSIVKHIVQSHGGEVFVNSVVGRGTTFSFTMPKA
ncbi:two-component system histidine kinase PnpS [Thermodesulfobacteriota bacterium]